MSQENAIRAPYKALSDGDLDAFLETLDPDIELLTSGAFPDFELRSPRSRNSALPAIAV